MINPDAKLAANIFEKPDMASTREGFGKGVVEAGKADERVVVLTADLAESTQAHHFQKAFPERFIQVGVAEQNLATVAAVINGMHAGVSVGPDGATHQALEDIAMMRALPNMTVISACDSEEGRKATLAAAKRGKPVYMRWGREKSPVMTTADTPFAIGKAIEFWRGKDPKVAIIGTGSLVHKALLTARELEKENIGVVVANVHTIKPLDNEKILSLARECGAVVSVEEHQVHGGLGGAIAELLAEKAPTPMEFVGMHDKFGQSGTGRIY